MLAGGVFYVSSLKRQQKLPRLMILLLSKRAISIRAKSYLANAESTFRCDSQSGKMIAFRSNRKIELNSALH